MASVSAGHIILDTDPTSRERAATAGIEPGPSSPGLARSTAELPRPPHRQNFKIKRLTILSGGWVNWIIFLKD